MLEFWLRRVLSAEDAIVGCDRLRVMPLETRARYRVPRKIIEKPRLTRGERKRAEAHVFATGRNRTGSIINKHSNIRMYAGDWEDISKDKVD